VSVVVVDVDAQDMLELSAACDQEPVEAVAADRSDPAFSERVRIRRPKRGADDLDARFETPRRGAAELAGWDPTISSLVAEVEMLDEPEVGIRYDGRRDRAHPRTGARGTSIRSAR
jgi:hypothetical protein